MIVLPPRAKGLSRPAALAPPRAFLPPLLGSPAPGGPLSLLAPVGSLGSGPALRWPFGVYASIIVGAGVGAGGVRMRVFEQNLLP